MNYSFKIKSLITVFLLSGFCCFSVVGAEENNDLAPEATTTEAALSFRDIPDLNETFIDTAPRDRKDGILVGELGIESGNIAMILKLAQEISENKHGRLDSLLIAHKGALLFESYYLKGRINLPHPQASATKVYTSLALGRAIELGYLTMADLDKPLVSFLKDLDPTKFAAGVEKITLHKAMTMRSGIHISKEDRDAFEKNPTELKEQGYVQAYLEHTAPITTASQKFKYKDDPRLVMQVIDAVVPGTAKDFIKNELLDKMGITNYRWGTHDITGLPESGWRVSMTSRDMVKWGTLVMNKGKWNGEQLIPEAFIVKATSRILYTGDDDVYGGGKDVSKQGYGYFWWSADLKYGNKNYLTTNAQGGGGQYIILIEELDLMVVVTAHDNDNSTLQLTAERILPSFNGRALPNNKNPQLDKLIEKITEIKNDYNVPAVGLSIIKNGEIQYQGSLGLMNKKKNIKADENTFYRLGSITKVFTGLALLKLEEKNQLKLSDSIDLYLDEVKLINPWKKSTKITLEQLMEHTSGLPDIGTAEFAHEDSHPITLTEGLNFVGQYHKALWPPGRHSSYSNLGVSYVGLAIEKASGHNYDEYLQQAILQPLNMYHSSTLLTPYLKKNMAQGYSGDGQREVDYWHIIMRPFGALNSSPKEMSNFLLLMLNRGTLNNLSLLTNQSIERMESSQTTLAAVSGLKYGYGFGNYYTQYNGFIFHGHGGTASGFLARYDYLLDNKSAYAVMINSSNSSAISAINQAIRDYLIADLQPPLPQMAKKLDVEFNGFQGYYQAITARGRITVFLLKLFDIKHLEIQNGMSKLGYVFMQKEPLIHVGNHFFRYSQDHYANTAFIKNKGGIYLQDEGNYKKISNFTFYFQSGLLLINLLIILYGVFYLLYYFSKLLLFPKSVTNIHSGKLFRLLPHVIFFFLFMIMSFFSPDKGSMSAFIFEILRYTMMMSVLFNMGHYYKTYQNNPNKFSHCLSIMNSLIFVIYLYYNHLIDQPIWS